MKYRAIVKLGDIEETILEIEAETPNIARYRVCVEFCRRHPELEMSPTKLSQAAGIMKLKALVDHRVKYSLG